jgi:hypothetical protein
MSQEIQVKTDTLRNILTFNAYYSPLKKIKPKKHITEPKSFSLQVRCLGSVPASLRAFIQA